MKFDVIVMDPPFEFKDKLKGDIKRGAAAQYETLSFDELMDLPIVEIFSENSILVLWVPSSFIFQGCQLMKKYGFRQTQTFIWVKHKKLPLSDLAKDIKNWFKITFPPYHLSKSSIITKKNEKEVGSIIDSFDINGILSFYMGRLFRQTHEIALVGVKGKVYDKLDNRSQRSVLLSMNIGHSSKPEGLQDRLDLMFPKASKLEMFARRDRDGWTCVGWECPSTPQEDVRDSIKRLEKL